jgi:hypothetical protein
MGRTRTARREVTVAPRTAEVSPMAKLTRTGTGVTSMVNQGGATW